jgi:energy-coupling factor transporter ATP-binding protein EcfA2
LRLSELSAHLKLTVSVLEEVLVFMRAEKLCEVTRRGGSGTDADLTYHLTDAGRDRAAEFIGRNAYAGPAPVTVAAYCAQVEAQSVAHMQIVREDVAAHFSDIAVNPAVLDQIGAAMNSSRAIFLHGPAGSGKTFLAEHLAKLLKGAVLVPYAIVIDGELVQMYDPMVHVAVAETPEHSTVLVRHIRCDPRWVICHRPAVLTGGELTLPMLDLQFDAGTRFYQAPPHLKANNGLLIIDDLGRQNCSPTDLMNRWIVPLDRRIDYLSLHTGHKFQVPFDVVVVFSSNLPPERLEDAAFLRRIGYKIHIGALSPSHYEQVFRHACTTYDVPFCADAFAYLLQEHYAKDDRPLLACHPRDLLSQIRDRAMYERLAPRLDTAALDWAWNNYFIGT